tara:strand:+ start:255 stop:491 length:237 start_codon:yes stop_codon:yes gene_type:complete
MIDEQPVINIIAYPVPEYSQTVSETKVVVEEIEEYCGPKSICLFVALLIIFPPVALFVPCCPCDYRKKKVQIEEPEFC